MTTFDDTAKTNISANARSASNLQNRPRNIFASAYLRFTIVVLLTLWASIGPARAAPYSLLQLSMVEVSSTGEWSWSESRSDWTVSLSSAALTCQLGGDIRQSTQAGRCALVTTDGKITGPLTLTPIDDTHVRARYQGVDAIFELDRLFLPSQQQLGPYVVTLMRLSWKSPPTDVAAPAEQDAANRLQRSVK